jgi:iron complex outermembrane receptor protein
MHRVVSAGMVCLFGFSTAATAQDVITVTGDRRGENQADASTAIGVLDADLLGEISAQHPSEALNRLAGVHLHRGNGAEHLTSIRSPILTGGAGAGSFLYLEDGIPMRAAGFGNVNALFESVADIAGSIEVLPGPGTALHGSNALHGTINILTPDPDAAVPGFEVELGSFGRGRAKTILTTDFGAGRAMLAIAGQHEDGWRDAASLDRLVTFLGAQGQAGDTDWRATLAVVSLNQETAGFVRGPNAYQDLALSRTNNEPEAFRDALAVRASVAIRTRLDNGWQASVTPYVRFNEMKFRMHFVPSKSLEESGHQSIGVISSLSRDFEAGRLTVGFDHEQTFGDLTETQTRSTIFSYTQGEHYNFEVNSGVSALYAQAAWQLDPVVTLHSGLRLEHTRFDYTNHLNADSVGRFLRLPNRSDNFTTLTPHIGANWQIASGVNLFARAARGARAPQVTELYRLQINQQIEDIEPETLDSVEAGVRFGNSSGTRLQLTSFAMRKRNVFFRDADGFNVTDGRTRHAGVELSARHNLSEQFAITFAGSWSQHEYDFDRNVGRASEIITAGDRIDTAPDWLWTTSLDWQISAPLSVSLTWSHVGSYFTDAANEHSYAGHDVWALRARYQITDQIEIFGSVRNLFDERYATRADYAFGSERYFPGEPRALSVGVRVRG